VVTKVPATPSIILIKNINPNYYEFYMRTFTVMILVFVFVVLFLELTGIDFNMPTKTEYVEETTVVLETIDEETGEVLHTEVVNKTLDLNRTNNSSEVN